MRFRRAAAATIVLALIPSLALACMWDYDTLKMERQRFPTALELITGKFLRHSPEFYEWRIRDREAKLAADPNNLAYLDDLAAAYDKVGKPDKAIEIMQRSAKLQPVRYETESNIALFFFHAGQLETSLQHVESALKINPDAHFGREKYQKYLTEYVISRRVDGKIKLPLAKVTITEPPPSEPERRRYTLVENQFSVFLTRTNRPTLAESEQQMAVEKEAAIKGVLGMIRFANHESPVLLEALGTLLSEGAATSFQGDAKRLSARAFLKASYGPVDENTRRDYRAMAEEVLEMQVASGPKDKAKLNDLEPMFQQELVEARDWYAELREKELGWIRDGKNPEEEFDKLYDTEPEVSWAQEDPPWYKRPRIWIGGILAIGVISLVLVVMVAVASRIARAFP